MKHGGAVAWIWYVAARYIFKGRGNSLSPILAVLGIATGVLALIVILAVMNGFQLSFIESILEISSYHLRLESFPPEETAEVRNILAPLPEIKAVLPFREFQGLIRGRQGGQQAVVIRGLPAEALELDPGLKARLEFEAGAFAIADRRSALLGAELARRLGLSVGDEFTLFSISGILSGGDTAAADPPVTADPAAIADDGPETGAAAESAGVETFTLAGIFRTGFYEYDTGWGFINIKSAGAFSESGVSLGLKLHNRFQDRQALEAARRALAGRPGFEETRLSSWRDYNRSFFGALRTEKLFMFILVGLIFIVVGLNIFQAQRRSVLEHREEIGLLMAVGGRERAVRFVFVCDGAIIGFTGAVSGLVPGLFIASHISLFFSILESIVNFFIGIINVLMGFFGAAEAGNFMIFSPAVFYIKGIPSRIIPHEVALIFMFGFLSALLAAWFASGRVSRIRPAEVLRYE
ncbi:MAG: ABC transporter permease [Treponema sp.]|jgi:lipoprotein-releasing system permease protein|nr:ABC transporter permease [Treponema sp.]